MLLGIAAAVLLATTQSQAPKCVDPATPLRELALSYDHWPAQISGKRGAEAFAAFQKFLKSSDESDYHVALLKYRNLQAENQSNLHVKVVLGVLLAAGPDINYPGGEGYRHTLAQAYSNAAHDISGLVTDALAQDSTQWIAAMALEREALSQLFNSDIESAMSAINRALSANPNSTVLHLAYHDLLTRLDRNEEALKYASDHAVACPSFEAAIGESLMLTGDTAHGSSIYLSGLDHADAAASDRYYDDIRPMATIAQKRAFGQTPVTERSAWLRAFWNRTAIASGRTLETRVLEQVIRGHYADLHYRKKRPQDIGPTPAVVLAGDTAQIVPWDGRGVYYVRHGPPEHKYYSYDGEFEYEVWTYLNEDPPVLSTFVHKVTGNEEWANLVGATCGFGHSTAFLGDFNEVDAVQRVNENEDPTLRDIYLTIAEYDNRYYDVVRGCGIIAAGGVYRPLTQVMGDIAYDNAKNFRRFAQSESAYPHFTSKTRLDVASYQFRNTEGRPEIIAVASVPMVDLQDSTGRARRLRIAYGVYDTVNTAFGRDTVIALPAVQTGVARVAMPVQFGALRTATMRITIVDPDDTIRGATRAQPLTVRRDDAKAALSDIVIGDPGRSGSLVRGAYHLSPVPGHRVRQNDQFRVFYELYGATEGEQIKTTIVVKRTDQKTVREQLRLAGKRPERTLSYDDRATLDERGVAARDVELGGDLVPGRYSVDVTVKLQSGLEVKRVGTFVVGDH